MFQFSVRPRRRTAATIGPISLVICLLAMVAASAAAQTVTATTGAVNGIVTDSTKAVVPGVTVSLSGPSLIDGPDRRHR